MARDYKLVSEIAQLEDSRHSKAMAQRLDEAAKQFAAEVCTLATHLGLYQDTPGTSPRDLCFGIAKQLRERADIFRARVWPTPE